MKIKRLKEQLDIWFNDDDEIIVTWWEKEYFENYGDTKRTITDEQWQRIVDVADGMDTSETNQALDDIVDEIVDEERINKERGIK